MRERNKNLPFCEIYGSQSLFSIPLLTLGISRYGHSSLYIYIPKTTRAWGGRGGPFGRLKLWGADTFEFAQTI